MALLIADELHLLGGPEGPTLEVVVSRMRYISSQLEKKVSLSTLPAYLAACVVHMYGWSCDGSLLFDFSSCWFSLPCIFVFFCATN